MQQRDARICTAKAGFFRSEDNSPSSGHVTRRSLLCHLYCGNIPSLRLRSSTDLFRRKRVISP